MGWQYRVLASPVPLDAMVALRLNAVVVDLAVLGPQGWTYLDKLCARLPGLGVIVCTGQSSVAQRVRGLRLGADDWVTKPCHPGGADRPHRGGRAPAQARRRARREGPGRRSARSRSAPTSSRPSSRGASVELTRREFELIQLLAEAEGQVLQREEIYQRVWGYAMVHGDRSVDVFVRKLRSKLERASPSLALHPHPLRDRLPLLGRAGRGARWARPLPVPEPEPDRRCPPSPVAGARAGVRPRALSLVSGWVRTATSTSATSRSSSRSRSPSGRSRAAAPPRPRSRTSSASLFLGGLCFLGYRSTWSTARRSSGSRSASAALHVRRPGADRLRAGRDAPAVGRGALGAMLWLAMLGASGWALYSVWRAYKTY